MPLYSYTCSEHGDFDELNSIAKRQTAKCPKCGQKCQKKVTSARLDYYNMGVQDGLPTAVAKWDKMHRKEAQRDY